MARSAAEKARAILDARKKKDPLSYFTPTPTQVDFLRRSPDDWASLITSVSRGGKSTVSCVDLAWVLRGIHPYRNNYKNLTIIQFTPSRLQAAQVIGSKLFKKSELLLPDAPPGTADFPMIPPWEIEKLNEPNVAGMKVPYECIMKNGNRLLFSWAGVDGIAKRIAGLKLDAAYVDENAGTPALFQELYPRLLDSQSDHTRPGLGFFVWSNTNVDYNEEFEAFQDRVARKVKGFRIFQIGKNENPAINTEKRELLREVIGGEAARIRMEGDLTAGDLVSIYAKQWSDERHIAKDEIPVDASDNIWAAYDPGVDHPMGLLIGVLKRDNPLQLNIVQAWNYRGETIEKDVDNLAKWLRGRKLAGFVYDTNLKNKDRGGGPSVLERMKELMANRGIVPMAGWWQSKKNHAPGIALVRHYLDPNPDDRTVPPLMRLSKPTDTNGVGIFRQQMLKYRGREATKFTGEGGIVKKDDEACLVAGTRILMADGTEKPIEEIAFGDCVQTPIGPCRVLNCGCTGCKPTILVKFDAEHHELRGTLDHKVFTQHGLRDLSVLRRKDRVPSYFAGIAGDDMRKTDNMRQEIADVFAAWHAIQTGNLFCMRDSIDVTMTTAKPLHFIYEGIAPVYNLTVEHAHCYFANGILVSNCDCFRYLAMCRPSWNADWRCGSPMDIATQSVALLDSTGTIPQQAMSETHINKPRFDFASGVYRSRDRYAGGRSHWRELGI